MDCIFCKIINGELPSKVLYEDNIVKVIMNIDPYSNGHILIIPVKHFENFLDIDDDTILHIHDISKLMKQYLYESLNPDGLTLSNNYGLPQSIKHYHLHLVPVYKEEQKLFDIEEIYIKIRSVI